MVQTAEVIERQELARRRISWGAVLAAVALAITVQLLLSMLGIGIGMSTIDPVKGETPTMGAFSISAGVWGIVTGLIALFIGGWAAGRLAGMPQRTDGILHGLLTWSVAILISVYLLTSAVGTFVGGAFGIVGDAVSAMTKGAQAVAPELADAAKQELNGLDVSWKDIKSEALALLQQTDKQALQPGQLKEDAQQTMNQAEQAAQETSKRPQQADENFDSLLDRIIRQGQDKVSEVDQTAIVNIVADRTNMSQAEAQQTVERWQKTYQQAQAKVDDLKAKAKQQAVEAAEATAKTVSTASIWTFIALLLGAIVAAIGGAVGTPKDLTTPTLRT